MKLSQIEDILHQRRPYLMIDEVLEVTDKEIRTVKIHHGDEAHLGGHFPGSPVVPGAMLQEICTQSAAIIITKYYSPVENYSSNKTKGWALGVLNKVNYAKYLEITKPNSPILAEVKLVDFKNNLFKFSARIFQNKKLKAKLSFNLTNISDDYLL